MATTTLKSPEGTLPLPRAPPRLHRQRAPPPITSPRFDRNTLKNNVPNSMFVIDPKTLATRLLVRPNFDDVLEGTNTRVVRFFVWLRRLSESWFTHVFLLLALILYALIGGAIFSSIEGRHEGEQNAIIRQLLEPIDQKADEIVESLWQYRQRFPMPTDLNDYEPNIDPNWYREVWLHLDQFDQFILDQCSKRLNYSIERFSETNRWDFIGSVFFSMTVFTTIGYGDNPPATPLGHLATMIYSFFGIPLLLIVLADFGRIFTKSIKYMIMFFRRLYYDRRMRSVRHMSRQGNKAARVQAALLEALNKIQRNPPFFVDPKTGRVTMMRPPPNVSSHPDLQSTSSNPTVTGSPPTHQAGRGRNVPLVTVSPSTPTTSTITPDTPMPAMLAFDDLDDEFNLPISLALFILMFYLFLGAILFWATEKWSLFHSFYFVFISMSTIGFGDFVPTQFNVLLYAFMYFLFGLALTSMCINVIQEKLSSTFERAKITIGESIGLDPNTPITISIPESGEPIPPKSSRKNSSNKNDDEPVDNPVGTNTAAAAAGKQPRPR